MPNMNNYAIMGHMNATQQPSISVNGCFGLLVHNTLLLRCISLMVSPLVCEFMGPSGLYANSNMLMMHQVSCPGLLHQYAFCINTLT